MEYFVYENGTQTGPFTVEQLRERGLRSDVLVWAEGMEQWQPAWKIQELRDIIEGKQTAPTGAATPPPVPPQPPVNPEPAPEQHHSSHAGRIAFLAIAIGVFIALFVTNPDRSKHSEAIAHEIEGAVTSNDMLGSGLVGMFFSVVSSGTVTEVVNQLLEVDSYGVCSVGHIRIGKHDKTVSFGILGHVYTFDSDDVVKKLKGHTSSTFESQESDDSEPGDSL